MESDPTFSMYRERRERMYDRLDVIREQVTEWIEKHEQQWPELTDLARLEALHAERNQLLIEFQQVENTFIDYVLKKRRD
jgi:hypothetical protein